MNSLKIKLTFFVTALLALATGFWVFGQMGGGGGCGNGICDAGETSFSCPMDCGSGGGGGGSCGNNTCDAGETSTSCPADCSSGGGGGGGDGPVCGNNVCETSLGETSASCPSDCSSGGGGGGSGGGSCGNNTCDAGETSTSCPADCSSGGGSGSGSGTGFCGNNTCDSNETAASCPNDCGPGDVGSRGPVCGDGECTIGEDAYSCLQDCEHGGPVGPVIIADKVDPRVIAGIDPDQIVNIGGRNFPDDILVIFANSDWTNWIPEENYFTEVLDSSHIRVTLFNLSGFFSNFGSQQAGLLNVLAYDPNKKPENLVFDVYVQSLYDGQWAEVADGLTIVPGPLAGLPEVRGKIAPFKRFDPRNSLFSQLFQQEGDGEDNYSEEELYPEEYLGTGQPVVDGGGYQYQPRVYESVFDVASFDWWQTFTGVLKDYVGKWFSKFSGII